MRALGNVVIKEVVTPVVEVKAPKKLKFRPWVKVVMAVGIIASAASLVDVATVSQAELAKDVTWVDAYAHDGDGYERIVRRANGTKDLDIKAMSSIMQDRNNHVDIKAGQVVLVPVLEDK